MGYTRPIAAVSFESANARDAAQSFYLSGRAIVKRDIAGAGLVGLIGGGLVFVTASWLNDSIPLLVQGTLGVGIAFFVVLALALFEMPLMVWALRKMARDASTPRLAVLGAHVAYCSFAAV